MKLHGEQVTASSIDVTKLNVISILDALTSQATSRNNADLSLTVANLRKRWVFKAQWDSVRAVATDSSTPWKETSKTTTTYTVDIVLIDTNTKQTRAKDTGNVDLTATFTIYLLPQDGLEPSTEDIVTWNNDVKRVVSVQTLAPKGYPQLYIVGLV
jgi:hypothetical protein